MRNAAAQENVQIIGTLGILDQLFRENAIDGKEMRSCLEQLNEKNGKSIRLPQDEIDKRLSMLTENK